MRNIFILFQSGIRNTQARDVHVRAFLIPDCILITIISCVFRKRKSVIVQNAKHKIVKKKSFDEETSMSQVETTIQEVCHPHFEHDLHEMQSYITRHLMEDEGYILDRFRDTFETAWSEINLGEEPVADFIRFCKDRKHFKVENWTISNRQFRYSYIFLIFDYREPQVN